MRLRVGVIGVGHMGQLHAAKVAALARSGADVSLAGVTDRDAARAERVAGELGAPLHGDAADLLAASDAVVVAVPTTQHFALASQAMDAGRDVLVEKPIAATVAEGAALLEKAARAERVLQVGHLEWYNAAMRILRARVREPRFVEVHRMGPFPARGTDVDVVRDLMIHDLDILQRILGEEPDRIDALGVPVITDQVDIANARIGFPSGCVANLTASRVARRARRKMRFFQRDGYLSVDFLEQSATLAQRVVGEGAWPRVERETARFEPEDALLAQLRAFVEAVRKRDLPPSSGASALAALRTALRVMDAIRGAP